MDVPPLVIVDGASATPTLPVPPAEPTDASMSTDSVVTVGSESQTTVDGGDVAPVESQSSAATDITAPEPSSSIPPTDSHPILVMSSTFPPPSPIAQTNTNEPTTVEPQQQTVIEPTIHEANATASTDTPSATITTDDAASSPVAASSDAPLDTAASSSIVDPSAVSEDTTHTGTASSLPQLQNAASTASLDSVDAIPANRTSSLTSTMNSRGSMTFDGSSLVSSTGDEGTHGFQKTLSSDVSAEQAMELLRNAHGFEPLFGELFESSDLPACNAILSILTFQPGERIITQGEDASFAAMILEGECIVQTSPTDFWPLPTYSWVGEMAFLERGPRAADVTAKTSATLAVLSYEDLERLSMEGQGSLQHKFTMLWSMHTIAKLRNMIKSAQDKANAWAAAAQNCKCEVKGAASTAPAPATPAAAATTTVATTPATEKSTTGKSKDKAGDTKKKETLFVERLKKQSELLQQQELKQKTEIKEMREIVKKKITEAQYAHESVKGKITKLETENKDLLNRVNDLSKKITLEKKKAKEASDLANKSSQEKLEVLALIPDYEKKIRDEKQRVKVLENTRKDFEASFSDKLKGKDDEILALQTKIIQLEGEIHGLKESHARMKIEEYDPLVVEKDRLAGELKSLQEKFTLLENEKGFSDFRVRSLTEQKDHLLTELSSWRRKSQDLHDSYEKLKNKYRQDLSDVVLDKKKIQLAHQTYHKLIRMLSLKTYVRNFLLRRWLFNIHLKISEMVVNRWEEKLGNVQREHGLSASTAATGGGREKFTLTDEKSLFQQLSNATAKNKKLAGGTAAGAGGGTSSTPLSPSLSPQQLPVPTGPGNPLLSPYPFPLSITAQIDPSNPASEISVFSYTTTGEVQHIPKEVLRTEKKKYLMTLKSKKNPPPTVFSLLQSIEEELIELKTPVDEMNLTILDLRSTLASFFQRNVQLTTKCLNTKKALEVAIVNYNSLKESVRVRHIQEQSSNPFSQHLILETSKQLQARKASPPSFPINLAATAPPGLGLGDEKEDTSSSPPTGNSRPSTSSGVSHPPKKPSSSDIDWAALDHEPSSGYGVTHPRARRESKMIQPSAPGGSNLRTPGAGSASARDRRPSMQFQPRPPTAPPPGSQTAAAAVTPSIAPTIPGSTFTLPKV